MTDFHTHILPLIDDGSQSIEESIKMLDIMSQEGIKRVIATPHFYADDNSVEEFLKKRNEAFESLKNEFKGNTPKILLGAEVRYYEGITALEDLKKLCIEGTDLLLLEMPFLKWSSYAVNELIALSSSGTFTVVLAHIERYSRFLEKPLLEFLLQNGILLQMNSSEFLRLGSRKKAISLLKKQKIHFLGSDCHNLTTRQPNLFKAYEVIAKKLSKEFLKDFENYGNSLFS